MPSAVHALSITQLHSIYKLAPHVSLYGFFFCGEQTVVGGVVGVPGLIGCRVLLVLRLSAAVAEAGLRRPAVEPWGV